MGSCGIGKSLRISLLALALIGAFWSGSAAYAAVTDNLYPTANYAPNCIDGNINTPGITYCKTDNAALSVWVESSISVTSKNIITNILNGQFNPTDLNVSFASTPVYTGGAETDIIYRLGAVPSGAIAVAYCDDAIDTRLCDQHYVSFNDAFPIANVICHESGHAVGLTHGQNAAPRLANTDGRLACMRTPSVGSITTLEANNEENINANY